MREEPLESVADAMASAHPAVSKAARLELERRVHAAARPGSDRRPTIGALRGIALAPRPRLVRAHALRLLGFIGDRRAERAIARLESDPEIGEDARMARERIRRGP